MKSASTILCVMLLMALASSPAVAEVCSEQEVADQVKQLGYTDDSKFDPYPVIKCFLEHASYAAGLLVNELRVVPERDIVWEDYNKHPDSLHVIWALRLLRAITGVSFEGGSAQELKSQGFHKNLDQILMVNSGDQVKFFGVYEGHQHLVIAPKDIQAQIIAEWHDWYKSKGGTYDYHDYTKTIAYWYD